MEVDNHARTASRPSGVKLSVQLQGPGFRERRGLTISSKHGLPDNVVLNRRLHAACPGMLPCGVDTRLAVPASVPVSITLAEGDVWVTGLDELRLDLADGSADVEVDGRLVASVGAGSVRAWLGADTQASVAVGRGDVDVVVASVTHGLDLSARSRDVVGIIPDDAAAGRLEIMAPAGHARVRGGRGVARR